MEKVSESYIKIYGNVLFHLLFLLITIYQEQYLGLLSQYKDQFFISETQIICELIKPANLSVMVRESVTVIKEDKEEIKEKTKELVLMNKGLSVFDCLCMAYALLDGYCLVTDDKILQKKCVSLGIEFKTSKQIIDEFLRR